MNIPRRFDPEQLTVDEAIELIKIKVEKEANRYVHNWPELDLSVQNGRWGPFIKYKRTNISFPKVDGNRMTSEDAAKLTLEEVQALVEAEVPDAFKKKSRGGKKKSAASE